jgi:hypothetical protein
VAEQVAAVDYMSEPTTANGPWSGPPELVYVFGRLTDAKEKHVPLNGADHVFEATVEVPKDTTGEMHLFISRPMRGGSSETRGIWDVTIEP